MEKKIYLVFHAPKELREAVQSLVESQYRIQYGIESIGCDSEPITNAFRMLAYAIESTARQVDPLIGDELRCLMSVPDASDWV